MSKLVRRYFFIITAAFSLVACGFHLRGYNGTSQPMPLTVVVGSTSIANLIKNQLKAQKALVAKEQNASLVLVVISDQGNRVASALTTSAQVREVELSQTFTFLVRNNEGNTIAPKQTIKINRFMRYEESLAIAKETEMEQLVSDMKYDIAQQVMVRLRALAQNLSSNKIK